MRTNQCIGCKAFPCTDVRHEGYAVPDIELDPEKIAIVLVSEAAPAAASDYYYAGAGSLFQQTTLLAFQDAGVNASSIQELVDRGVYFTTAVKCAKTGYAIQPGTIEECSQLLDAELALFPRVQAYLLMGDVAIKAVNAIARRGDQPRVIPAGSTYKLRGGEFFFNGRRAFPSYLQAGPSFFIEKSKRKAIAEDIAATLALIR